MFKLGIPPAPEMTKFMDWTLIGWCYGLKVQCVRNLILRFMMTVFGSRACGR
jgi:hypothetical protein